MAANNIWLWISSTTVVCAGVTEKFVNLTQSSFPNPAQALPPSDRRTYLEIKIVPSNYLASVSALLLD